MAAWVGNGYVHFASYSYDNLLGQGNVNLVNNINYGDYLTTWNFIYFGYSRLKQQIYGFIKFNDKYVSFSSVARHYLAPKFIFYIAQD